MDVWQIGLYGFAAFVALRLLVTLMDRHRLFTLQRLTAEHQNKLAEEQSKRNAEAESTVADQDSPASGAA